MKRLLLLLLILASCGGISTELHPDANFDAEEIAAIDAALALWSEALDIDVYRGESVDLPPFDDDEWHADQGGAVYGIQPGTPPWHFMHETMGSDIGGACSRRFNWVIVVRQGEYSFGGFRDLVAHEVGHYLGHAGEGTGIMRHNRILNDPELCINQQTIDRICSSDRVTCGDTRQLCWE